MRIKTFLVFATEQTAQEQQEQISTNMGLSDAEQWAIPEPRNDGKWGFKTPADEYMTDVQDYITEEWDAEQYHIVGEE